MKKRYTEERIAYTLRQAEAELASAKVMGERREVGILQAKAELDQDRKIAEANDEQVAEAGANHKLAQQEFARVKDLVARGISSQADLDLGRSALDARSAQLRAAIARLRAAESTVAVSESRVRAAEVDVEVARANVRIRQAARCLAAATLANRGQGALRQHRRPQGR